MRPARYTVGDLRGIALEGKRARNAVHDLVAGAEYGWLTVIKRSAGDGRYTVFRCRCGAQAIRLTEKTVKHTREGACPRCDACNAQHKRELIAKKMEARR